MSGLEKIFDFNEKTDPTGLVGRAMELGWPCVAYRVTLPKIASSDQDEFNAFERCILKLIANGCFDSAELASATCLTLDFVELILLKLRDRAKIDSRNQLMPNVRKEIEKLYREKESALTTYETYVIFRECVSNTVLPMLVDARLRSEEINEDRTVGRRHIHLRSFGGFVNEPITPTQTEVLSALRTMARRQKAIGIACRIPSAEGMRIVPKGERCRLRVRMVMQRTGDGDWRILNPFGVGWSPELEMSYQEFLKHENSSEAGEIVKELQSRNADMDAIRRSRNENNKHEPFETLENTSHYPELIRTLKRKHFKTIDSPFMPTGDNGCVQEEATVDVYAAIEWTLFYALQQTDVKKLIQMLGIITREESMKRLKAARDSWHEKNKRIANDIAVENMPLEEREWKKREKLDYDAVKRICSVPSEAELKYFMNGVAKMQTVLPLAILMSADDSRFIFNRLAENCPRFLPVLAELKYNRDSKRHGKVVWREIYGKEDMKFMKIVVETLLPSVRFSKDVNELDSDIEGTLNDARISARVAVQDKFGVSSFIRMDARLQEALISAEIFRREHEKMNEIFDALDCVNNLYAATQCAFRPLLLGARSNSATIENAKKRAQDTGLGSLPSSMLTVRDSMLRRTLDGDDQTLQACVVAWILLADDDFLRHTALIMPDILSKINRLIEVNGHGNQCIPMHSSEMNSLCKNVYKVIKTLTEA